MLTYMCAVLIYVPLILLQKLSIVDLSLLFKVTMSKKNMFKGEFQQFIFYKRLNRTQ